MSAERLMAELLRTDPDDPAVAAAAEGLARKIMALTQESGANRLVVGAALGRCTAGFYARLAVEAGDEPETAGAALLWHNVHAAEMAVLLARKGQKHRPPSLSAGAGSATPPN